MTSDLDRDRSQASFQRLYDGLKQAIPAAVERALNSYQAFSSQPIEEHDPDSFIKHHKACKAALAHLDHLTKITKWMIRHMPEDTLTGDEAEKVNMLDGMLTTARTRLIKAEVEERS